LFFPHNRSGLLFSLVHVALVLIGNLIWLASEVESGDAFALMRDVISLIWVALVGLFQSRVSLEAEILALRHQLNVLPRKSPKKLTFTSMDGLVFVGLYLCVPKTKSERIDDEVRSGWRTNL
jgi:hypothetical protein